LKEFNDLLNEHFDFVSPYGQRVYPVSYLWTLAPHPRNRSVEFQLEWCEDGFRPCSEDRLQAMYAFSVCSDEPVSTLAPSLLVDADRMAIVQRDDRLADREELLKQSTVHARALEAEFEECGTQFRRLETAYKEVGSHISDLETALKTREADLAESTGAHNEAKRYIKRVEDALAALQAHKTGVDLASVSAAEYARSLQVELDARDAEYRRLEAAFTEIQAYVNRLESELRTRESEFAQLVQTYNDARQYARSLEEAVQQNERSPDTNPHDG